MAVQDGSSALVNDALERALAQGEIGVQISAYLEGEPLVDDWTGTFGDDAGTPVDGETLFPIFSVSKAVTATALHIQAERGLVDYEAPTAMYWPEYGTRGKERITVRHVLTHRAGVPQMPDDVTPELMCDWDWMIDRLADAEPVYEPGSHNTYLSMVFGWLLGEVVGRTDPRGRAFAQFVAEEIGAPLKMPSLYFGVPAGKERRVAKLSFPNRPPPPPEGSLVLRAVPPQVRLAPEAFNRRDVHGAVIPAVGAIATASSLVRLFAMLAGRGELDGVRLLSEDRVLSFLEPRSDVSEHDETYGRPMPVGVGGYWLAAPGGQAEGRIISHTGAGGTLGWADVDTGLAVAFCHNRMGGGGLPALAEAVHRIAGV
jgi:CubicO group peptidase (beta-lactamase class C family)